MRWWCSNERNPEQPPKSPEGGLKKIFLIISNRLPQKSPFGGFRGLALLGIKVKHMKNKILSIRKKSPVGQLRSALVVALLVAFAFQLFCSKDYNPFADLQNARAHVLSWSFAGKDSVPVYTTGTLDIAVAVREKVDSFTVSASHNRFWPDTTVRRPSPGEMLAAEPFVFSISFCDTGMETVSVHTHRLDGGTVSENLVLRSTLPLRQADVTGFFGDTLVLSTPPVSDRDVIYQWEFGAGRTVQSVRDSARTVLESGISQGAGSLVVTDLFGNHATPPWSFSYSLGDTSHPVILCVNDSLHGDTLITRDSVLAFKATVVNYGNKQADSCWVNGSAFDIAYPQSHLYIKLFKDISTYTRSNPLAITVCAIGNKTFPLVTQKAFWAIFDPAGVSSLDADIEFIVPLKDSSGTTLRDCSIFGTAENFHGDTMVMRVKVNDSLYQSSVLVAGASGTWEWLVHLDSAVNSITVTASGYRDSAVLTSKHVLIAYDPTNRDTAKPVIWEINADGKSAGGLFTRNANVTLQVLAFDEGSGIQSVTINGTAAVSDSSGYIWRQAVALVHSMPGNRISVSAVDRNQNRKDSTVTIFRNTAPALDSGFVFPSVFYAGKSYSFLIPCKDADNDVVTVHKNYGPGAMIVSTDGLVSWAPAAQDAGPESLTVVLDDGYESSGPFTWRFVCIDSTLPAFSVHFTTREKDFPATLEAGRDTLVIRLKTDSVPAGATLLYSAAFVDRLPQAPEVIMSNTPSPLLVWAPADADTGFRKLRVAVGNGLAVYDTIFPTFQVVARNRLPCHLVWSFTGTLTPAGELDLASNPAPETLSFVISDSGDTAAEKYMVAISQHGVRSVAVLNKNNFTVIVRPDSASILDTLLVSVDDLSGTSDSATFVIRNTNPTLGPFSQRIYLNTTATGANVAGNVTGFPVLVRLTSSNFNFSQAQSNGGDIRFAKANGAPCSYEIERWIQAQGVAEIWVKVDTVYGNNGTQSITMYWGNSTATSLSSGAAVFDTANNFKYVWHLEESGNNNAGNYKDATANANNGTGTGTPVQATGAIGSGQTFSGANYISTTNYIGITGTAQRTLSAWVNINNTSSPIVGWGTGACNVNKFYSFFWRTQYEIWACGIQQADYYAGTADTSGSWVYTTATYDGTSSHLFANGVEVGSGNPYPYATADTVGQIGFAKGGDYYCKGTIDEARIENTARSADWIMLCYMNQKAADALVVFR
jgi:Concanavalin A-like lectin/glucanases superfamily/Domain of unknown function (DUF2341)